jgi:hypothetical protein
VRLSRLCPERTHQGTRTRRRDRGSALAAVPAMVLLTAALGAFVLDTAAVFFAARQLDGVARDVAKSAVSGLSLPTLYRTGTRKLDPELVERLAKAELDAARPSLTDLAGSPSLDVTVGTSALCVTLRAIARRPIAPALLGRHLAEIEIRAHALAVLAPPGRLPGPPVRVVSTC